MRTEQVRDSSALVMGGALSALYFTFLYYAGARGLLLPTTFLATAVLIVEALKVVLLFSIPRLRRASWHLVYPFVTAEIALTPVAYAALTALRVPGSGTLVVQFVEVYVAAEAVVVPTYTIYRLVTLMAKGGEAGRALQLAVMQFGLVAYVLEVVAFSTSPAKGLEGLGESLVPSAAILRLPSTLTPVYALIGVAGAGFYVSMMAYASLDQEASEFRPRTVILITASTLAAAALVLGSGLFGGVTVTLSAATFAVVLGVWWVARG